MAAENLRLKLATSFSSSGTHFACIIKSHRPCQRHPKQAEADEKTDFDRVDVVRHLRLLALEVLVVLLDPCDLRDRPLVLLDHGRVLSAETVQLVFEPRLLLLEDLRVRKGPVVLGGEVLLAAHEALTRLVVEFLQLGRRLSKYRSSDDLLLLELSLGRLERLGCLLLGVLLDLAQLVDGVLVRLDLEELELLVHDAVVALARPSAVVHVLEVELEFVSDHLLELTLVTGLELVVRRRVLQRAQPLLGLIYTRQKNEGSIGQHIEVSSRLCNLKRD